MKNKKTLMKATVTLVTLAAIFTTMTSFGEGFASAESETDQQNNQECLFDCIQINQENDEGNNNVGDGASNDGIEGEALPDAQTQVATPY
jgi:hypothetical protein